MANSVVNILFYFILAQGLPAVEGKRYVNGDSGFGYFIAYGVVRFVLEPLRNPAFIMGTNQVTSQHSDYKSYDRQDYSGYRERSVLALSSHQGNDKSRNAQGNSRKRYKQR